MSSIWTPSGEHRPAPEPAQPPAAGGASSAPAGDGAVSPEDLAAIRQMHQEIRATPAIDVIANHAVQLFELALVYLGVATPPDEQGRVPLPDLAQAGVAIDAMTTLVDGLGSRFGEHEQALRDGITQLQMVYVQVADELERRGAAGGPVT